MNCHNIQELLRGDYLDGACSLVDEGFIQEHLKKCPLRCELESQLRAQQVLLKAAKRQDVPEHVWRNIQSSILEERLREENSARRGFFTSIKDFLFTRPPAFAFGSGLAIILLALVVTGISVHKNQSAKTFDLVEYSVMNNETSFSDDLGTNIEKYFL